MDTMKIIGITGRAKSGKDTLAEFLVDNHGFKRVALADPLRNAVSEFTGIPTGDLMRGDVKEAPIPELGGATPRRMMQTLGTEWGRETVCDDIWLQVAARAIRQARREGYAGVVIPDVRFDNEAEFVQSLGGDVWEVQRAGVDAVEAHASEAGVHEGLVTGLINNDGPLHELAVNAELIASL